MEQLDIGSSLWELANGELGDALRWADNYAREQLKNDPPTGFSSIDGNRSWAMRICSLCMVYANSGADIECMGAPLRWLVSERLATLRIEELPPFLEREAIEVWASGMAVLFRYGDFCFILCSGHYETISVKTQFRSRLKRIVTQDDPVIPGLELAEERRRKIVDPEEYWDNLFPEKETKIEELTPFLVIFRDNFLWAKNRLQFVPIDTESAVRKGRLRIAAGAVPLFTDDKSKVAVPGTSALYNPVDRYWSRRRRKLD